MQITKLGSDGFNYPLFIKTRQMVQIKGIVKDEQDVPVAGALVAVEEGTAPFPDMALYTDAEGHFTIDLPMGRFRLAAYSQDGGHGFVQCDSTINDSIVILLGFYGGDNHYLKE